MIKQSDNTHSNHPVILFDGVCNLCNGSVDWLIRKDRQGVLRYGSLQSDFGQMKLKEEGLNTDSFNSIVLFDTDGKFYEKSTAFLRIVGYLGTPWSMLGIFRIIPTFIRDAVYGFIASNRYRWFGKRDTCRLPSEEEKKLFI